ncbi:MAG TPA: hypothetical protein VM286_02395 [Candidatus Thermoplasmatota archaeon]|nr:hypothetical protein [Candidatus Thermoplasmatota archaeon]
MGPPKYPRGLADGMEWEGRPTTRVKVIQRSGAGAVYGLGLLGALVYYFQNSPTFWAGVIGILKALFWPAFLVYELFKFLHL